jgi:hypothetical protein
MKKLSLVFLIIFGLSGILTNVLKLELFFNVFLVLFIPFLALYYSWSQKQRNKELDRAILGALFVLFLSDILELSVFKEFSFKDKIQIVLHFIVQLLFLAVFKKEGAILVQESKVDILKIFVPAVIIFVIFGFFVFEESQILNYVLLIIYTIILAILWILSMYRPINNYAYYTGVFGVSFLLLYGLFYFLFSYNTNIPSLYQISFGFYVFSEIFLVESFSTSTKTQKNE